MAGRSSFRRIAVGRARVVREVRAAGPLMAALRAPVTARGPWLTAVLNAGAAHRFTGRPVAVVVEAHRQGRPDAAAFLNLRRRGPATVVTLLGAGRPGGPAGAGGRPGPPAGGGGPRGSPGGGGPPRGGGAAARRSGSSPGTTRWPACWPPASTTCSGPCAGPANSAWPACRSA